MRAKRKRAGKGRGGRRDEKDPRPGREKESEKLETRTEKTVRAERDEGKSFPRVRERTRRAARGRRRRQEEEVAGSTFLIQGEAIKMTEPLLARADLYPFTTQRAADKK